MSPEYSSSLVPVTVGLTSLTRGVKYFNRNSHGVYSLPLNVFVLKNFPFKFGITSAAETFYFCCYFKYCITFFSSPESKVSGEFIGWNALRRTSSSSHHLILFIRQQIPTLFILTPILLQLLSSCCYSRLKWFTWQNTVCSFRRKLNPGVIMAPCYYCFGSILVSIFSQRILLTGHCAVVVKLKILITAFLLAIFLIMLDMNLSIHSKE